MLTTRRMVVYLVLVFVVAFVVSTFALLWIYKPWAKKEKVERSMWLPSDEHPKNITIITRHEGGTKENDTTKYDVNKYDITGQFLSYEYEFKKDAQCIKFKHKGKDVWDYETTGETVGYPRTITFNTTSKKALFEFPEHFYYYKLNENDQWVLEFKIRRKTLIELETSTESDTNEVDYRLEGDEKIFTPKDGYLITSVKHHGNKVWNTNKSTEAAQKVIIKTINNLNKVIVVHSINGKITILQTSKRKN